MQLRTLARVPADGADVALSAFENFFRGFAAGRFANVSSRDDLWRLDEIARSLDCGLRTVERRLEVIRKRWIAGDAP